MSFHRNEFNYKTANDRTSRSFYVRYLESASAPNREYDSLKLKTNFGIQTAITMANYRCLKKKMNNEEYYESFKEQLVQILRSKKIIRKERRIIAKIRYTSISKLVAKRKKADPEEIKRINKMIKEKIKSIQIKRSNKFIEEGCRTLCENKTKMAWNWLKRATGIKNEGQLDGPLKDKATGQLVTNSKDKGRLISKHLAKLAEKEQLNENDRLKPRARVEIHNATVRARSKIRQEITDESITWEEIKEQLTSLRDGRAASIDLIPCELYKLCSKDKKGKTNLSKIIHELFNRCLNDGYIPKEWRENTVIMVYKKGGKEDLDNYRGITLINTLSKIYCKIIASRLAKANETTGIIRREQTGFIEGEIGLNTVATVIEIMERRKQLGMETHLCFVDFKKAYDLVPHDRLITKLSVVPQLKCRH